MEKAEAPPPLGSTAVKVNLALFLRARVQHVFVCVCVCLCVNKRGRNGVIFACSNKTRHGPMVAVVPNERLGHRGLKRIQVRSSKALVRAVGRDSERFAQTARVETAKVSTKLHEKRLCSIIAHSHSIAGSCTRHNEQPSGKNNRRRASCLLWKEEGVKAGGGGCISHLCKKRADDLDLCT